MPCRTFVRLVVFSSCSTSQNVDLELVLGIAEKLNHWTVEPSMGPDCPNQRTPHRKIGCLFNSSQRLTLYIVYFTVSSRLFYRQKIGRLLRFWRKGDLKCTTYSFSLNFIMGEPLTTPLPIDKGHYCVSVTTTIPRRRHLYH